MYLWRSNWKSPYIFQVGFSPSLIVCGIHGFKEFDCLLHIIEVQISHALSGSSNEIYCNCEIFYEIIPVCECLIFLPATSRIRLMLFSLLLSSSPSMTDGHNMHFSMSSSLSASMKARLSRLKTMDNRNYIN